MDGAPLWFALGFVGAGMPLATIIHEMGHLSVALLLRLNPRVISIGRGRIVFRRRLDQVWFVIRKIPLGGYVELLPVAPARRISAALFILGGVGANAAAFVALGLAVSGNPWMSSIAIQMATAQLLMAVINLAPFKTRDGYSDGVRLVVSFWNMASGLAGWLRQVTMRPAALSETAEQIHSKSWREIVYQTTRRGLRNEVWVRRDAASTLSNILEHRSLPTDERVYVLDSLLSFELVYADTGVPPACLDVWSAEALKLAPTALHHIGRSLALATLDRTDEARLQIAALSESDLTPAERLGYQVAILHIAVARNDHLSAAPLADRARNTVELMSSKTADLEALEAAVDRVLSRLSGPAPADL